MSSPRSESVGASAAADARAAGDVTVQVADTIATVQFSHPKGNSLPGLLLQRLAHEITALGARDDVHVIILRSAGEGPFCAGASFDELQAIRDANTGTAFFMGFATLIIAMTTCPRLIITRVHGRAVGGGVGIVAASDYAMAHDSASLRLSELAVGIGPFVVGPVIAHRAGSAALAAMAIDADWRDARWGEQHGLYARLYHDAAELDLGVDAFARRLAASSPEAMQTLKRVLWEDTDHWPQLLAERARLSGTLVLSDFTRQAIANFRAPRQGSNARPG